MNDVVLELRGIHKSYNPGAANAVSVLEDVNVTLLKGQISALVAPSGAGKSTLLHISGQMIAGALQRGAKILDLSISSIIFYRNSVHWKISSCRN